MKPETPQSDTPQPAAYDANGRPLYAHPPQQASPMPPTMVSVAPDHIEGETFDPQLRKQYANEPAVVHAVRELEPEEREPSDELKQLHDASAAQYPFLNLSRGEHVILAVRRHPIGLFVPVGVTALLVIILLTGLISYPMLQADGYLTALPDSGALIGPALLFILLIALGGYIAVWVYLQNKFFMTNESVIQEIQYSLFSRHEQTVSLGSIEDASYRQTGILQLMFNYGTIRLSTEGEETTYRFYYVENPKKQIAILNNAVEAFKNGRPVTLAIRDYVEKK